MITAMETPEKEIFTFEKEAQNLTIWTSAIEKENFKKTLNDKNYTACLKILRKNTTLNSYDPVIALTSICEGNIQKDSIFKNKTTWNNFNDSDINKEIFLSFATLLAKKLFDKSLTLNSSAKFSQTYYHLKSLKQ
jgi:hypothetical protein